MRAALAALTLALALALAAAACGSDGSGEALPASVATGTVEAVPAATARTLPSDWLGFNGEAVTASPSLWHDSRFVSAVAELHPEALRIFGGTPANFWDWRHGTFVSDGTASRAGLPPDLETARSRVSVSLADWAHLVHAVHATPVFDLNIVSSTVPDQIAMLREARALGMPVTRVELGNELYLGRYRRLFEDGAAYGRSASRWAAAVKAEFPDARVAAAGFVPQSANGPISDRERTWNESMLSTLRGVDALTFHPYFQAGLTKHASLHSHRAVSKMLLGPSQRWAEVQSGALAQLKPGMSAWLTEYNLFDRVAAAHTTWAQGLALASYSLDVLADPRVDQADIHALVSSAPFGALFADRSGLGWAAGGTRSFNVPRGDPPATQPLGLSATGVAAAALLAALRGATVAQPLAFDFEAPRTGAAVALRGEQFAAAGRMTGALMVNLSSAALLVHPPAGLTRARFDQRWGPPSAIVSGDGALRRGHGRVPSNGIVLPAYSITVLSR